MERALVDLVLELAMPLLSRLGADGVESAVDLVGLYPHVDAFMDALYASAGTRVDADLRAEVACVYGRVHGAARKLKQQAVATVVAERLSVHVPLGCDHLAGRARADPGW